MNDEPEIKNLDTNTVNISSVELAHIYIRGEPEPLIIQRDGRTFNLKIIISVSDVSDETPEAKPAGT